MSTIQVVPLQVLATSSRLRLYFFGVLFGSFRGVQRLAGANLRLGASHE
jgi:hypothetical protein